MDIEMNEWTKNLLSKIISRIIKKKVNYDLLFKLNDIKTKMTGDTQHIHLDMDIDISKKDLFNLLKGVI